MGLGACRSVRGGEAGISEKRYGETGVEKMNEEAGGSRQYSLLRIDQVNRKKDDGVHFSLSGKRRITKTGVKKSSVFYISSGGGLGGTRTRPQ